MTLVDPTMATRVASLIERLVSAGETVAVAESLTGGLLCSTLVYPAGASRVVVGGVVAYHTDAKVTVLGVPETLLVERGAVDPAVAAAMAEGVRVKFGATIGMSTTGVAGPDTQDGVAVGTVFVALSSEHDTAVEEFHFAGDRDAIRLAAVEVGIALLENSLRTE